MIGMAIVAVSHFRRPRHVRERLAEQEGERIAQMWEKADIAAHKAVKAKNDKLVRNGKPPRHIRSTVDKSHPRTSSLKGGWPR